MGVRKNVSEVIYIIFADWIFLQFFPNIKSYLTKNCLDKHDLILFGVCTRAFRRFASSGQSDTFPYSVLWSISDSFPLKFPFLLNSLSSWTPFPLEFPFLSVSAQRMTVVQRQDNLSHAMNNVSYEMDNLSYAMDNVSYEI